MRRKIRHNIPAAGTVIRRQHGGRTIEGTVFARPGGTVGIEIDGVQYPSPSAAAKAVTGYKEINGWLFWRLDSL